MAENERGRCALILETWHLDIEDFLELRKNTGDERRRTHDMNTANWIPDLFMKRVSENGMWTLFSPSDVPDLHDLYGSAFEKRYIEYEKMADDRKDSSSSKRWKRCSFGAKCSACSLKQAILGSLSKIPPTSAPRKTMSASSTARISAQRSCSTPQQKKQPSATWARSILARAHDRKGTR